MRIKSLIKSLIPIIILDIYRKIKDGMHIDNQLKRYRQSFKLFYDYDEYKVSLTVWISASVGNVLDLLSEIAGCKLAVEKNTVTYDSIKCDVNE